MSAHYLSPAQRAGMDKSIRRAKKKQLSQTEAWMREHPVDVPCPRSSVAAKAWRVKRGLDKAGEEQRIKYQVAMIETKISE